MTGRQLGGAIAVGVLLGLGAAGCRSGLTALDGGAGDAGDDGPSDGGVGAILAARGHVSGTRLRARTWQAEGGARLAEHFAGTATPVYWDTALGVPCTFSGTHDQRVCTPVSTYVDPAVVGLPRAGYADATCGARVALGPWWSIEAATIARAAFCGPKRYATILEIANGGVSPLTYEAGPPLAGTSFYQSSLGQQDCGEAPLPAGYDVVTLGPAVAASTLVSAHLQRLPTGGRLQAEVLVADDGTHERVGWFDPVIGAPCTVRGDDKDDGKVRCLPEADPDVFLSPVFLAGESCDRFGVFTTGTHAVGAFVLGVPDLPPVTPGAYYRVGPKEKNIRGFVDGKCVVLQADVENYYALGVEVPRATFDAFTDASTGGRVRVTAPTDADGAVELALATVGDTTTNAPCSFVPTSDGKLRCLPAWDRKSYRDPACTAATAMFVTFAGPSRAYGGAWTGDLCTGGFALAEFGAALTTPANVYDTSEGGTGCTRNAFIGLGPDALFREIGAPVALSTFPEVELVNE